MKKQNVATLITFAAVQLKNVMHTWTFEMNIFEQHFYDKNNKNNKHILQYALTWNWNKNTTQPITIGNNN